MCGWMYFQPKDVVRLAINSTKCPVPLKDILGWKAARLSNNPLKAVAEGNSQLSAALHAVLKNEHADNLIFSPFSLSAVVVMAHLGARGSTAAEIASAFRFPEDNEVLSKGYSEVLASLQGNTEGCTLVAANRLYLQIGYAMKEDYSESIKNTFGAEVQQLDFANRAASAAEINGWVERTTRSKIKDLISPNLLNSLTRVVLVNGVYFKGPWQIEFYKRHTTKQPFHLNGKESIQVDMMYKKAKLPYSYLQNIDAHVVALPYRGGRFSMVIFAPEEIIGLAKIEDGLKNLNVSKVLEQLSSDSEVKVHLPKFKVECSMCLVQPLKNLGVKRMFDEDQADFSGILESKEQICVSAVVQKAFIEVNEEGTEACAATGVEILSLGINPRTYELRADRPFYYQIVDRKTNFILFAGAVKNPAA